MTCKEYREKAQNITSRRAGTLAGMYLLFFLITLLCGFVSSYFYLIGSLVSFIVSGPLTFGLIYGVIKTYKKEAFGPSLLFDGFKDFTYTVSVYLLYTMLVTLGTIAFIVPGLIFSLQYSMCYYIHIDHEELTVVECLKKSKQMMYGHKTELFKLLLSYIGWILLGFLTLGILFLWVSPRMETAKYLFYLNIKDQPEVITPTSNQKDPKQF